MTGFSEQPGQGPVQPESPQQPGFEVEPLPPTGDYPGRTLGIVGFILAIVFNIIGLIVSIVAYNQSKKAGRTNGWAVAGIWIAIVEIVVGAIVGFAAIGTGWLLISNS